MEMKKELLAKAKNTKTPEELLCLAKENGEEMTEESAKAKGLDVIVKTVTLKLSGRYIAENEGGNGVIKLIIGREHKDILGVHMIGNYASEIIFGAVFMIESEMRVEELRQMIFPHPTVCEILREGLFQFKV